MRITKVFLTQYIATPNYYSTFILRKSVGSANGRQFIVTLRNKRSLLWGLSEEAALLKKAAQKTMRFLERTVKCNSNK